VFSKAEKDLYREAAQIRKAYKENLARTEKEETLAKAGRRIFYDPNKVPKTSIA